MTAQEAAERARQALQNADEQRALVGCGPLDSDDHPWSDWEQLIAWRIMLAFGPVNSDRRPDMEALELAAGFVLAAMIALDRAETVDVSTGTAA